MTNILEKLKERLKFRKTASFKSMIKGYKNYENIDKVINFINSLEDGKTKAKLIKQAKHYFATKFNMQQDKILFANEIEKIKETCELCAIVGDLVINEELSNKLSNKFINVRYVVGNLEITADDVVMQYLLTVYGDLKLSKQTKFSAERLETVKGFAFNG